MKRLFYSLLLAFLLPQNGFSFALAMDIMGEAAKPLIGIAKEKAEGIMRVFSVQTYGGYSTGSGSFTKTALSGGIIDNGGISAKGYFAGARGGLEAFDFLSLGVDYTYEFAQRTEKASLYKYKSSMLGITIGFDIPFTPFRAFGADYFEADLGGDGSGSGWGAGISFMLVSPFMLIAEYRSLSYYEDMGDGQKGYRTINKFYTGLCFLLL